MFEVIEQVNLQDVDAREVFWIAAYDAMNPHYGYNKQSGGNLNKQLSNETKLKIGDALRGRRMTPEQIAHRVGARKANGNLYHSTEERIKISENITGKPKSVRSQSHRDKIRQNQTGKTMTPESIQKRTESRRRNNNGKY